MLFWEDWGERHFGAQTVWTDNWCLSGLSSLVPVGSLVSVPHSQSLSDASCLTPRVLSMSGSLCPVPVSIPVQSTTSGPSSPSGPLYRLRVHPDLLHIFCLELCRPFSAFFSGMTIATISLLVSVARTLVRTVATSSSPSGSFVTL